MTPRPAPCSDPPPTRARAPSSATCSARRPSAAPSCWSPRSSRCVWANSPFGDTYQRFRHLAGRPARPRALGRRRRADACSSSSPASSSSASSWSARCAGPPTPRSRSSPPCAGSHAGADLHRWSTSAATATCAAGPSPPPPTSPSRSPCSPSSGRRCRRPLRAFLLTLAVVDDLVVIVIIAVFYTSDARTWCRCCSAVGAARVVRPAAAAARSRTFLRLRPARGRHLVVRARERHPRHHRRRRAGPADPRAARPGRGSAPPPSGSSTGSPRCRPGVAVPFFALLSAGVVVTRRRDLLRDPVVARRGRSAWWSASRSACSAGPGWSPGSPGPSSTRTCPGATWSASRSWPASGSRSRCWSPTCPSPAREAEEAKTAVLVGSVVAALLAVAACSAAQPRATRRMTDSTSAVWSR